MSSSSPKLLVANWKSNFDRREVETWLKVFPREALENVMTQVRVVVCPSSVHLPQVSAALGVEHAGAQTVSPFPNGPYTGAVSAAQVAEFASVAIVGHVERRKHFGETAQVIGQQAVQAIENGLTPIIAVDRTSWATQLNFLNEEQLRVSYVMYEPAEAISTGGGHPSDVADVEAFVEMAQEKYNVAGVLYGGSVDEKNAAEYFHSAKIAGAVVGAASLDTDRFQKIIAAVTA